jgi:pimeloyl-[acyl-carrier protein] methyl ester esterase
MIRLAPACMTAVAIALAFPTVAAAKAPSAASAPAFVPTRFSVEVIGAGPDVILIPGLSTPRDVWQPAAQALKAKHRVHLIQIRGFGEAPGANASGPVLAPFVAELARYIAENHLQKPAVIGHSLGGLAALMLAADQPELPGRVMVVDAFPFIGKLFDPAATAESMAPRAEQMRGFMLAAAEARKGQSPRDCSTLTGEAPAMPGVMSNTAKGNCMIGNWTLASDAAVSAQAMVDDLSTDMQPRLGSITAPLTIAYAQDDRVLGPGLAAQLYGSAYVGAKQPQLVPIAGSFHFTMLDQPEAMLTAIRSFLGDAQ